MSSETAIDVEGLSKCFHIYDKPIDRLKQSLLPRLSRFTASSQSRYYREFWALTDITLQVKRGETVGIIGRNGSGKSTLLQIICGTLDATRGSVRTRGRIAALLELGAGFNPEFTGRENVYLNATVLGLTEEEVTARFDRIAAFADIGEFLDQPVKIYSSGMYARLAFAVAINVDPDILIVDEALAVGDEPFQRKCFARIEAIKNQGGSILFVSHSGGTIVNLCDRAVLLNKGRQLFFGTPKRAVYFSQKIGNHLSDNDEEIIAEILAADRHEREPMAADEPAEKTPGDDVSLPTEPAKAAAPPPPSAREPSDPRPEEFFDPATVSRSGHAYDVAGAEIQNMCLMTEDDRSVNQVFRGRRYQLQCDVHFSEAWPGVRLYALIRTTTGVDLAGCAYPALEDRGINVSAACTMRFQFPFVCMLNPATYFCNFAVQAADGSLHHRVVDGLAFRVLPDQSSHATGIVDVGFAPRSEVLAGP